MTVQTIRWPVEGDGVAVLSDGGSQMGNGKCDHLMIGYTGSNKFRAFADFKVSWECSNGKRAKTLKKAEVVVKTTNGYHHGIGSSAHVKIQRLTQNLTPGTVGGSENWTSANDLTWANQPAVDVQTAVKKMAGNTTKYTTNIDVIINDICPTDIYKTDGVTLGPGGTFRGLRFQACNSSGVAQETDTSFYTELQSLEASGTDEVYIEVTVDDNQAPAAPVNMSPTGDAIATSLEFSADFSDPDELNYIGALGADIEFYADDGTTLLYAGNFSPAALTQPTSFIYTPPTGGGGAFTPTYGVFLRWRARVYDQDGSVSPWSGQQRFKLNRKPSILSPTVDTDSLSPFFRGTISDPDPSSSIQTVRIFLEDVATGLPIAGSPFEATVALQQTYAYQYTGGAIAYGQSLRYNAQIQDNNGTWSDLFTTWKTFTESEVLGPTAMTPKDLTVQQLTRTPTLTIGHSANFDYHEIEVYDNVDGIGTALYDPGVVGPYGATGSKAVVYAGTQLVNGRIYYWRAKVRNNATTNWTEWSQLYPFYITTLPPIHTVLPGAGTNYAYNNGTYTIPSRSPSLTAPYADPDYLQYADSPAFRQFEVYRASDSAVVLKNIGAGVINLYDWTANVLESFAATTGWVAGAGTHTLTTESTSGFFSEGGQGLKIAVAAQTVATTVIDKGPDRYLGSAYSDFSSSLWTQFLQDVRCSSLTNLSAIRLYFYFSGNDANFAYFTITPAATVAIETKTLTRASPTGTGGSVNWAQVHRIGIGVVSVTGAYTGNVWVDNLRANILSSTHMLALDTAYNMRVRYKDQNTESQWGAWPNSYTSIKPSAVPVVVAGTAPDVTDPTPTIAWTPTMSGGKAQYAYVVRIKKQSDSSVVYSSGVVLGTATTHVVARDNTTTGFSPLIHGVSYKYEVDVYDTDLLLGQLAATNFSGAMNYATPHRVVGAANGTVATTLAALTTVGATNARLTSVTGVAVGQLLLLGSGSTATVGRVIGPIDAAGVFNGTAGSGGTGVNFDDPLENAQSNGAAVASVADLAITFDDESGRATVTWDTSKLASTHFQRYIFQGQNPRTKAWEDLAYITSQSTVSYTDDLTRIGSEAGYRVLQDNGAIVSQYADIAYTATNTDWYWTVPGHSEVSGKIVVRDYSFGRTQQAEAQETLGSNAPVVELGQFMLERGSITLQILAEDLELVLGYIYGTLALSDLEYVAVKNYIGDVYKAVPAGAEISRRPWGSPIPIGELVTVPLIVVVA